MLSLLATEIGSRSLYRLKYRSILCSLPATARENNLCPYSEYVLITNVTLKSRDDQVSASVNMESRQEYREIIYYNVGLSSDPWAVGRRGWHCVLFTCQTTSCRIWTGGWSGITARQARPQLTNSWATVTPVYRRSGTVGEAATPAGFRAREQDGPGGFRVQSQSLRPSLEQE